MKKSQIAVIIGFNLFMFLGVLVLSGCSGGKEEASNTTSTTRTLEVLATTVQSGGTGIDAGTDVAVTADGDAIVTGVFSDTATFGSTTLIGAGNTDVFVGKVSSRVGWWEWVAQIGGIGSDAGFGVSVTSDGGAIVTGEFADTATFGSTTLTSNGDRDVFVGKVSSTGVWEWVVQSGGTGYDSGFGVAVTSDGGAIVTGEFTDTATFGSTTLTSKGDAFVGKVSSTGVWEWVVQSGGTPFDSGFGVSVTSDGGAIITGEFADTATFGSTTLTSNGEGDVFVGKVSSTGVWEWVVQSGGTLSDAGYSVAVTSDGGAIVTGWFTYTATFGSTTLTSGGDQNVFMGKISSIGLWEWLAQSGGTGSDAGYSVAVTSDGGAIVTGWFTNTASFGPTTLTSKGDRDVFVGKVSSIGLWEWVAQSGGIGSDGGDGVAVTSDGGAIVTGWFNGRATFGYRSLTSSGGEDVFVGKISSTGVWES